MYEPTQVPPTRNVAFKFIQVVPQLTYLERQKPRCKQPSAGPLVDARTTDAPCTPLRPASPGLPVSENASTTLRRFSNATPAAFALRRPSNLASASACPMPAARARSCYTAPSSQFSRCCCLSPCAYACPPREGGRCAKSMSYLRACRWVCTRRSRARKGIRAQELGHTRPSYDRKCARDDGTKCRRDVVALCTSSKIFSWLDALVVCKNC